VDEAREIVDGAVDLYVHGSPDLLPRRLDDLALAAELRRDGIRAAVHRNHFSLTAERSRLVSDATGFDLRGAVLLNGTVGGLDPRVVEKELRMGACWVAMPTLSGRRYQSRISDYARSAATMAGPVDVVDGRGVVFPAVHEILQLVRASDAVLNLGYIGFAECMAVLQAAREHRVQRIVASNPTSILGLSTAEIDEIMAFPEVTVELCASSIYPLNGRPSTVKPSDLAAIIRRFGAERCAFSSDSGHAGAPTTLELLTFGCLALSGEGITTAELRALVCDTPARLLKLSA
jgi:hypothetical protein